MIKGVKIAVIGGTGALGSGLAARWAMAGAEVLIGSRRLESAEEGCARIRQRVRDKSGNNPQISFGINADVAQQADIVALTVPFKQQQEILLAIRDQVQGKIVIDTTVPLVPPGVGTVQIPPYGSAALSAQIVLGTQVKVVSAFHNVAADKLQSLEDLECDVLVFGDDKDARTTANSLVEAAGMRAFHGGRLANSIAAEALTSVLITINRQFKCQAGIRIVGAV